MSIRSPLALYVLVRGAVVVLLNALMRVGLHLPRLRPLRGFRFALRDGATPHRLFHYLLANVGNGIAKPIPKLVGKVVRGHGLLFPPQSVHEAYQCARHGEERWQANRNGR